MGRGALGVRVIKMVKINEQSEKDQEMMNILIELHISKLRGEAVCYRELAKGFDKDGLGNLGHRHRVMAMTNDIMIEMLEG